MLSGVCRHKIGSLSQRSSLYVIAKFQTSRRFVSSSTKIHRHHSSCEWYNNSNFLGKWNNFLDWELRMEWRTWWMCAKDRTDTDTWIVRNFLLSNPHSLALELKMQKMRWVARSEWLASCEYEEDRCKFCRDLEQIGWIAQSEFCLYTEGCWATIKIPIVTQG